MCTRSRGTEEGVDTTRADAVASVFRAAIIRDIGAHRRTNTLVGCVAISVDAKAVAVSARSAASVVPTFLPDSAESGALALACLVAGRQRTDQVRACATRSAASVGATLLARALRNTWTGSSVVAR